MKDPRDTLLRKLDEGHRFTLLEMQALLGLSERQVRRILRQPDPHRPPILSCRENNRKVYFLADDRQRLPVEIRFDLAELRALAVAAIASRATLAGTPLAAPLERAFAKLAEKCVADHYVFDLEEPALQWSFSDGATTPLQEEHFSLLAWALEQKNTVLIDYHSPKSGRQSVGRRLSPYCFVHKGRSWLLVAYCHQSRRPKTFALPRISRVVVEAEPFSFPDDFNPEVFFKDAFGVFNSDDKRRVVLAVEPDRAVHFQEKCYHSSQQITGTLPDGRLRVAFEVAGLDEIRSFCQGWGVGITVIEPPELRERLRQEAEVLLKRYSSPRT